MTTFSISIGRRCAIANKLAQSSDLASAKATQTVYSILVDSYSATQKENYQMFKDETGKWRTTPFKENVSTTFNASDEQILEFRSVIEWLSSRLAIDREDTALFAQITAAASTIDDTNAANAVIALINAIGTVEHTAECGRRISEARIAYDALTDAQKAIITAAEYKVLTDAEEAYSETEQEDNE